MTRVLFCTFLALTTALVSQETHPKISETSEAFGHLIGKNLQAIGVDLDLELVVKGLRDAATGKDFHLNESECMELLAAEQERVFQKRAGENLAAAEEFLKQNAQEKNVVTIEEGKIQYRVEKKGKGNAIKEGDSPAIKYVGRYLDGSIFGKSEEEQIISLNETVTGFTQGLLGMQEGEKRTVYIHPDRGYGTRGGLQPNSLLTFEVEVLKADVEKKSLSDALILDETKEEHVADPLDAPQIR